MASYDYLIHEGQTYQTTDFDGDFSRYEIRDGRLFKDWGRYVEVPKSERPFPESEEGSVEAIVGSMKWESGESIDMDFHGIVEASDYRFKFTDGVLVEVKEPSAATG